MPTDSDEWLNPTEAAEYLGISRQSLYKLMDSGHLPFQAVMGIKKRRIKKADLDALRVKGGPEEQVEDMRKEKKAEPRPTKKAAR